MASTLRRPAPDEFAPTGLQVRHARLTAAVDQVLALVADGLRSHPGNRQLTDLALDVQNELIGALAANAEPPRRR